MGQRRRRQVRGWHFWRRAFWTRPALVVVYAVLIGAAGLLVLLTVPARIGDARAMPVAAECPRASVRPEVEVGAPEGCLERLQVVLSGPHLRRGPGTEWWLHTAGGRLYAQADFSSSASRRLSDGDSVEALLWEGETVLIEPSPGERVESEAWGHGGWLARLYIGLFVLSFAPMLLQSAKLKRSTASGWWAVDGEKVGLVPAMTPLMAVACVLAVPAMLGFLPLVIGGGVGWSVTLALLGLALAVFAAVKQVRRTDINRD